MSNLAQALISYAQSGGKNSSALLRALAQPREREQVAPPRAIPPDDSEEGGGSHEHPPYSPGYSGMGFLQAPTSWKGTHITDNLDWNQGQRSATDIMAKAGTWVGAPESGKVQRYGGAQGGSSAYFQADDGTLYWMGHIDPYVKPGAHVKRGGRLVRISAGHAAPHLHIDRKY